MIPGKIRSLLHHHYKSITTEIIIQTLDLLILSIWHRSYFHCKETRQYHCDMFLLRNIVEQLVAYAISGRCGVLGNLIPEHRQVDSVRS